MSKAFLLLLFIAEAAAAQDSSGKNNSVSVSLVPLLDRTISLTYARRLRNGNEITFNPRVRIAKKDPHINNYTFRFKDPQWYYDRYQLRSGLILRLGKTFSYEPQIQLGYSSFTDKVVITEDVEGEAYDERKRVDRRYYSAGIINMASWIHDYNWVRLKIFIGVGAHARRYFETQYEVITFRHVQTYPEPLKDAYYRFAPSFHGGIELGIRY